MKSFPIYELLEIFGFRKLTWKDNFIFSYDTGIVRIEVRRHKSLIKEKMICEVDSNYNPIPFKNEWENTDIRNKQINSMKNKGFTQQELAELFDLSQAMISKIISK